MSATIVDFDRFALAEIKGDLYRWGKWIEDHQDYEGFPSRSAGIGIVSYGRGQPGHRVLCLDMPSGVYATHKRVLGLPVHEREAVWIWYVFRMLPDGTDWPVSDRARIAAIPEDTLRRRVNRARRRIAGLSD